MPKIAIKAGNTTETVNVFLQNSLSNTGAGLTGLTNASSGLTCYYVLPRTNAAVISLVSLAAANSAWSSGGFKEVDATNTPGLYRLDLSNAAIASGRFSTVMLFSTNSSLNLAPCPLEIELTGWDNQDGVHGGMSALPNTAVSTNGSLLTQGTGTAQVNTSSGNVVLVDASLTAAKYAANAINATVIADGSIDAATFAAGAINAGAIATGAIVAATFAASAINSGAIATGAITNTKFAAGAIDASVFAANAINSTTLAANTITAAKVATDAIGAAQLAADAVTEIQSGLATSAAQATLNTTVNAVNTTVGLVNSTVNAINTATTNATVIADTVLRRTMTNAEASNNGDALNTGSLYGLVMMAQRGSVNGNTLTIHKTDGVTTLGTLNVTSNSSASPITGVNS